MLSWCLPSDLGAVSATLVLSFSCSVLVSQLVSHLFWDAVSASLVLSFSSPWSCPPACLLGCVWSCFQRDSFVFRFCLPFQPCVSRLSLRWSGFDSCSLCDFTVCMGMSLPCACSLQLVFGLVSSLRFYTSVCCVCGLLSMYLWWKQLFFYGPPWRVTNNTTRHEKKNVSGCPTSWACLPACLQSLFD